MISFASAVGNLFNRLGRIAGLVENLSSYQQTQLSLMTDTTTGIGVQFAAEPDIQAIIGGTYIGLLNSFGGLGGIAQTAAVATINRMVFRDNPQAGQTLQSYNTLTSIKEVIRQMGLAGATVQAMTVTATTAAFIGMGNGVINVSTKRPSDGRTLENAYSEELLFTVQTDSYGPTNATEGNEALLITSEGALSDLFAFDWPLGSGSRATLNAIDGSASNSSGNLLTNSGFEDFTSDVPDNWTLVVGTGGVNVFEESTLVYDPPPNKALRFLGDSSTLIELTQEFSNASGTLGQLITNTQYSFNIFMRRDGVQAAAGVLEISLVDENNVIIQDEAGVDNAFTIDLTGSNAVPLTTVYQAYKGVFRTPAIMPDELFLRMRLTTAITTGRSVYLDKISFGVMTQIYTSGPFVAVHSGSIPFLIGDYGTATISNSRDSATLNTWQVVFVRFFPNEMLNNELMLPSSSVPTISDTLIG